MTAAAQKPVKTKILGQPLLRLEDPPLVAGKGRYAADVSFPHQLHMRIVRSDRAHARIKSIDTSAAKAAPGVYAVWTAEDIPEIPSINLRDSNNKVYEPYLQFILARGKVRYVGDPIAAVFAEDPYQAEDAADLVVLDADDLPPVLSAVDEPVEYEPGRTTEVVVLKHGFGDVDAAFKEADHIVECEVSIGRHSAVPMETRGAIGRHDTVRDVIELHGAAKVPHRNQEAIARMLKRNLHTVHMVEGHTGGGFGVRGELYPEDVLVCAAALRFGRPVKWIEDRREHLMAANQSRQQTHRMRAAVRKDGFVLAMEDEFFHDQGGYIRTHGSRVMETTIGTLPGLYQIPNFRVSGHFRMTNKTPCATYRSPGQFESAFARERLFDAVAAKLGMDKVELRRRNLIPASAMPFNRRLAARSEEVIYDSGDYEKLLDKASERFKLQDVLADVKRRRQAGEMVGFGISMAIEGSGSGPADGVRISVDPSGSIEVVTGSASIGQGVETTMAQIAAEAIGAEYKKIRVIHGRTDRIEFGIGAHASRATVMTGSATHIAGLKLRAKALDMASQLMQMPADQLDIVDGKVVRKDAEGGPSMTLGEIAVHLGPNSKTRGDREPGLTVEGWHYTDRPTYGYAMNFAVVKVDKETGGIDIEKYLVAFDVGKAVNPMMIHGQIVGGFAQGMAGALLEEFRYDERGEPLSVTFADYLLPTAHEVPPIDVLVTEDAPSPRNLLGIKGAGEAGVTGVGAVLASAVDDAIGMPGAIKQLPITPQRLKAILATRS